MRQLLALVSTDSHLAAACKEERNDIDQDISRQAVPAEPASGPNNPARLIGVQIDSNDISCIVLGELSIIKQRYGTISSQLFWIEKGPETTC